MRLIDDTATKIDVWVLFNSTYNDASRFTEEETEFAKRILSDVQEVIESQHTAFDLESAIEQLEEKIKIEHRKQPNCDEDGFGDGEEIYDDGITQGRYEAFKEALEILKSAANATNGKNGGRGNDI